MRYFLYILIAILSFFPAFAKGDVKVVDGDSLFIGDREIRLSGIDAPEYHQMCYDENDVPYACGKEAFRYLQTIVTEDVVCKVKEVDRYNREVADCFVGDTNINKEMVRMGYAVAYDRYTKDYLPAQKQAKKHKRGIWVGRFMKPELYRRLQDK